MKRRYVRDDDDRLGELTTVVRGGDLDGRLLREDASRSHAIYGFYGVSVFALRDVTLDELAQRSPLVRFPRLTLITVAAIRVAGLRLAPTGRNPLHFDICFDELERGIAGLLSWDRTVSTNPYHEP